MKVAKVWKFGIDCQRQALLHHQPYEGFKHRSGIDAPEAFAHQLASRDRAPARTHGLLERSHRPQIPPAVVFSKVTFWIIRIHSAGRPQSYLATTTGHAEKAARPGSATLG